MSISREKTARQERCRQAEGLTHENLYSSKKNNRYRKKSAALPAAALPFARGTSRFALVASAAADRDWNRTARTFLQKFACHRSERLGGIAAASRSAFFIVCYVSSVYTFFMRNPCIGHPFLFTGALCSSILYYEERAKRCRLLLHGGKRHEYEKICCGCFYGGLRRRWLCRNILTPVLKTGCPIFLTIA